MEEKKKQLYNPAIDLIRIISILGVIFIHTTTRTLEVSSYNVVEIPFTMLLNQGFRFAVPMFFMISGLVLELNYTFHNNYFSYLKKRVQKIFIPFIFWSAIYFLFVYPITSFSIFSIRFLSVLLTGDASYQLYFIPTLLIFYILFPLVHKYYYIFKNTYLIITLFIIQVILLSYDYYRQPLPLVQPLDIIVLNFFSFFSGIHIAHHFQRIHTFVTKYKIYLLSAIILLLFYIFFEGRNNYLNTHNYYMFYSQWRPSILIYSLLLFTTLLSFFETKKYPKALVKTVSQLSYFVFFIHIIILELVWKYIGHPLYQYSHGHIIQQLWYDPLYFIIVSSVSFSIAYLIHKIPYVIQIVG